VSGVRATRRFGWREVTSASVIGHVSFLLFLACIGVSALYYWAFLFGALSLCLLRSSAPPRDEDLVHWTGSFTFFNQRTLHALEELKLAFVADRPETGTIKGYGYSRRYGAFRVKGRYVGASCRWSAIHKDRTFTFEGTRAGDRIEGVWRRFELCGRFEIQCAASALSADLAQDREAQEVLPSPTLSVVGSPKRLALELNQRHASRRCPYCRDGFDLRQSLGSATCQGCKTDFHDDCIREAGSCTTLGCVYNVGRTKISA
jgi:hypothetical protein